MAAVIAPGSRPWRKDAGCGRPGAISRLPGLNFREGYLTHEMAILMI